MDEFAQEEDWLGLNEQSKVESLPPGLWVGAVMRNNELLMADHIHMRSALPEFIGSKEIIFIDENADGDGFSVAHATNWQRWMAMAGQPWPRLPTVEEAMAFKQRQAAKLEAAFWDDRRRAQEADDKEEAERDVAEIEVAASGRKPGSKAPRDKNT
jgi:hypothetical protein